MELKLTILKPLKNKEEASAKIYYDGKIGFSKGAVKEMNLTSETYFEVAINEDITDKNIYLIIANKGEDSVIKVIKYQEYAYLNTSKVPLNKKFLFNEIEYSFIIEKQVYLNKDMFVLKYNCEKKRKERKNEKKEEKEIEQK
jgi:hypothetical protein